MPEQQGLATYCCSPHSEHMSVVSVSFTTLSDLQERQDTWQDISHQFCFVWLKFSRKISVSGFSKCSLFVERSFISCRLLSVSNRATEFEMLFWVSGSQLSLCSLASNLRFFARLSGSWHSGYATNAFAGFTANCG